MAGISNGIIAFLNILTLLIAFGVLHISYQSHLQSESTCQRVMKTPLLIVGCSLLVISLAGLIGSCCCVSFIFVLYLFVLNVIIIALIIFTIFAVIVTNKDIGRALSNQDIGDRKLEDFSGWLQKYVVNAKNWDEIKSCMIDARLCELIKVGRDENYYKQEMPSIQSGCCKPPSYCGLEFVNATYWKMPIKGPAVQDPDCKTWSNDQKQLCFDCESCKKAILDNIKREWRLLAFINMFIILIITIVYHIGCCAQENNYRKKRRPYY